VKQGLDLLDLLLHLHLLFSFSSLIRLDCFFTFKGTGYNWLNEFAELTQQSISDFLTLTDLLESIDDVLLVVLSGDCFKLNHNGLLLWGLRFGCRSRSRGHKRERFRRQI